MLRSRCLPSISVLACVAMLASCGKSAPTAPAPAPSSAPILQLTPSVAASPGLVASPVAVEPTVGEIAGRIAAAWSGVRTYRATFTTVESLAGGSPVAVPVASPIASPVAATMERTVIDEVILPDKRHRTEFAGGQTMSEIISVDGVVYLRGIAVPGGTPIADPQAWQTLDPATFPEASPYKGLVDGMTAPPSPPYAGLSQDERERVAHPAGEVTVNGRICTLYTVADTTITGERIEVRIAIGADDLPCSIETRAGGTVGTTVFEFNPPITIEPPV